MEITTKTVKAVAEKFRKFFDLDYRNFVDVQCTLLLGYVAIDILKFDDWLHSLFGEYEDAGMSMMDCITKNFGSDACSFVSSML